MKNNTKKNGKKMKTIICGATILGVVGVSGIFAYFTDTDKADNKFTVGDVKIELYEPSWDGIDTNGSHDGTDGLGGDIDNNKNGVPDKAEDLTANQEVEKDPQVKNKGKNSAYVFLKVRVPQKNVVVANEDGTKQANKMQELFTYTIDGKNWVELTAEKGDEVIDEKNYSTHIYCYKRALEPTETTEPLFESVKLINIVEEQLDAPDLDIQIDAYAIQSDNLLGSSVEGIEDDLSDSTGEAIYNIYKNQNKE